MNKRNILFLSIIIFILAVSAYVVFVLLGSKQSQVTGPNATGTFPVSQNIDNGTTGGSNFGLPNATDNGTSTLPTNTNSKNRFTKITSTPVAGYLALGTNSDLDLKVRYVERETGHIYDYNYEKAIAERVSNTTIPRVQDVLWNATGDNLIFRYFDGQENIIKTFLAEIITSGEATSTETTLNGVFLPDNIASIAFLPNKTTAKPIFYLIENIGGATGYRTDIHASSITQTFKSTFGEWATTWLGKIFLYTKPSGLTEGFAYTLSESATSATESSLSKILGGATGLMILPNADGSKILFSSTQGASVKLSLYTNATGEILSLPVETFAEKCVWSATDKNVFYCATPISFPQTIYPDGWYMGGLSFSDIMISYNTNNGFLNIRSDMTRDTGERIDATNLSINSDDTIIFFKNKVDQTLWSFDTRQ